MVNCFLSKKVSEFVGYSFMAFFSLEEVKGLRSLVVVGAKESW